MHFDAAITWHGRASRLLRRSAETGFLDTPAACVCRWRRLKIMGTRSRKGGVQAYVDTVAYSAKFFHCKSLPDMVTGKKTGGPMFGHQTLELHAVRSVSSPSTSTPRDSHTPDCAEYIARRVTYVYVLATCDAPSPIDIRALIAGCSFVFRR